MQERQWYYSQEILREAALKFYPKKAKSHFKVLNKNALLCHIIARNKLKYLIIKHMNPSQ